MRTTQAHTRRVVQLLGLSSGASPGLRGLGILVEPLGPAHFPSQLFIDLPVRAFAPRVARAFARVRGVTVAVDLDIEMTTVGES